MIPDSPDRKPQPTLTEPPAKPRRPHRMTPARCQALQRATRASAKASRARAKERKREWRRQHGYWFFHRWGLYAIPFTRTLKRLGESVPGFITLLSLAERWLVRGSDKWQVTSDKWQVTSDEREGEKQKSEVRSPEPRVPSPESLFPNPQPLNRIASKVARALAHVLWLRPRVIRQRALDRAIRLEARLRAVAELQGILHGAQGAEAQARLTAQMKQELSCETLEEYKYMRMLGMEPSELWPRRLAWRIALRVREALEEGFAQERDLKAIRRRVELLLEAYQTAAEITGAGSGGAGSGGAGSQPACDRSIPTGQPGFDSAVGAPLVGALVDPTPGTSNVASAKARQRKLDRLRQVEESSVERLGSPFQAPGKVRRRLAGEVQPRRAASQQQTTEQKNRSGEPEPPDEFQAELERKLEEQRLRDPEWLAMERQEAKERRITVEQLRRSQQALKTRPDPVGVRRFWDPEAGWCAEIKAGWARYAVRISEMTGGREERCWPVVRELELRAEVEALRRGREPIEAGRDGREFVEATRRVVGAGPCARPPEDNESVGAGPRARPDEDDESARVICGRPEALASVDRFDVASKIGLLSLQGRAQGPAPTADAVDPGFTYQELKRLLTEAFGLAPGWTIAWQYTPPSDPAVADYLGIAPPRPPAPREAIERKLERVARLAWLMLEGERRRADQETVRLEQILAAARPGEFEPTAQALISLEAEDREAEFKSGERWARLSEALRNLLEATYGEYGEFGRMRGAAVWFDEELKRMMRQDLGLDPMPADFETPEAPEQFVHERRQFLNGLESLCAGRRYGPTGRPTWCDAEGEDA